MCWCPFCDLTDAKVNRGQRTTLTWTTTGNVEWVFIRGYTPSGSLTNDLYISGFNSDPNQGSVANTGTFDWNVPATLPVGTGYMLRVSDRYDNTVMAEVVFDVTEAPKSIAISAPVASKDVCCRCVCCCSL